MRNLEYKARTDDPHDIQARARSLGASTRGDLYQTDTYFHVPSGRLKLRETAGFSAELIFYQRAETAPNRPSDYLTSEASDPASLRDLLDASLDVLPR